MRKLVAFLEDESGATALEYAMLAALIGVAAVAALTSTGTNLSTTYSTAASSSR